MEYDHLSVDGARFVYPDFIPRLTGINPIHCQKTYEGPSNKYEALLDCSHLAGDITHCQKKGKKVTLMLLAPEKRRFTSHEHAKSAALGVWNFFLGGKSTHRLFGDAVMDGVTVGIPFHETAYFDVFVSHLRQLMKTDGTRDYIIKAFLIMDADSAKAMSLLTEIGHMFDSITPGASIEGTTNYAMDYDTHMKPWFELADVLLKKHGKAPSIAMPVYVSAENEWIGFLKKATVNVVANKHFGGASMSDADIDTQRKIQGRYFSSFLQDIIKQRK
jgi:hypothetical protein